ncbi:hypothetical protein GUJ93_ZPchr0006g43607 [Zizania palustris]|uniref:Uncharacterized protein n=1 Tax=Zizania palustris TaxID=103762 RepID=A0A8J5SHI1_ZIZPA|nr:hypothetical protein GUJ93_ZPchr0006g43607 [Zizania palustris]
MPKRSRPPKSALPCSRRPWLPSSPPEASQPCTAATSLTPLPAVAPPVLTALPGGSPSTCFCRRNRMREREA